MVNPSPCETYIFQFHPNGVPEEYAEIRVPIFEDRPYWRVDTVAKALGYSDPDDFATLADGECYQLMEFRSGNAQSFQVTTEKGLFQALGKSDSPLSNHFKVWTKTKVVPKLRRRLGMAQ
jgi:hypothetical protein